MSTLKVYNGTNWDTLSGVGLSNPMTTAGDIIYGGTSGTPTRLAKGTDGHVLTLASGNPAWAAASGGSLLVAETVVSDSAVANVTFTGLDGNAAGGYLLEILWIPTITAATQLQLNVNTETTASNYRISQVYCGIDAASSFGQSGNISDCYIAYCGTTGCAVQASADVQTINNEFLFKSNSIGVAASSSRYNHIYAGRCVNAVSNITSLTVKTNAGTASINIGSIFRLFKRK